MAHRLTHFTTGFTLLADTSGRRPPATERTPTSPTTREVDTEVVALIPQYEQVQVRDANGHLYALTLQTKGIDLAKLHAGQRVRCTVTLRLPRVLSATAIA